MKYLKELGEERTLKLNSPSKEKYLCILPLVESGDANVTTDDEVDRTPSTTLLAKSLTALEHLKSKNHCLYALHGWWSYGEALLSMLMC